MKATGIVRRFDDLGRIVIPKEIRKTLDMGDGASAEISCQNGGVFIRKYNPGCAFCGGVDDLTTIQGIRVCKVCAVNMADLYQRSAEA
jgi:looped-hinge helix DNA binding domain, AbrB family